jgi:hypothetical protein
LLFVVAVAVWLAAAGGGGKRASRTRVLDADPISAIESGLLP